MQNELELKKMIERVHEVAAALLGSSSDLRDNATEAERNDPEFLRALDWEVMQCDSCNWWFETEEINENGECKDCEETR